MKHKPLFFSLVFAVLITLAGVVWLLLQNETVGFSAYEEEIRMQTVIPAQSNGKGISVFQPLIKSFPGQTSFSTPTATSTATSPTQVPAEVLETFESNSTAWKVMVNNSGTGKVTQSQAQKAAGSSSALLSTAGSGSVASVNAVGFSDPARSPVWGERPRTWFWQRAMVYLPSATLPGQGPQGYLDLAGFWPGAGGAYGWWLRVRQDGLGNASLSVMGYDANGSLAEFRIYGLFPLDRWVDFTMGLNSQNGPGVKRSFAVLIDGNFYGWYHQGHMSNENFNQAAIGILNTNVSAPLNVYIDQWYVSSNQAFPASPDNRSTGPLQTQDFRNNSGVQWQIDWSTWENDLRFDPVFGLYSSNNRLQSGRNLERMPDLTSGWAQIVIDWPKGTPPDNASLTGSFAGLIGFHKEINREQNLEVSPIIENGSAVLVYDAWTGNANTMASWTLPKATALSDGRNIPEPGDILRVRWEKINSTSINVRVSYYDASTTTWYRDVINDTHNLSSIPSQDLSLPGNVNFLDGYHQAASITIDTSFYSIRSFTTGTLDTYQAP